MEMDEVSKLVKRFLDLYQSRDSKLVADLVAKNYRSGDGRTLLSSAIQELSGNQRFLKETEHYEESFNNLEYEVLEITPAEDCYLVRWKVSGEHKKHLFVDRGGNNRHQTLLGYAISRMTFEGDKVSANQIFWSSGEGVRLYSGLRGE